MSVHGPATPGTARMSLAALAVTLLVAALWRWQPTDWWWVAGVATLLLVLLGSWRGVHLTTLARRKAALFLRNRRAGHAHSDSSVTDVRTTVLLELESADDHDLPLPTLASYLHRYGITCAGIRVTRLDPQRRTLLGVTISAADNMTALLARGSDLPLHETAHVLRRRLAEHLRELGWDVHLVDAADLWPDTQSEHWRGVRVRDGHLAAYDVTVDGSLPETLSRIAAYPSLQTWTVLELTGRPAQPQLSVACAVLTADKPGRKPPIAGATPYNGIHGPALHALNPVASGRRPR